MRRTKYALKLLSFVPSSNSVLQMIGRNMRRSESRMAPTNESDSLEDEDSLDWVVGSTMGSTMKPACMKSDHRSLIGQKPAFVAGRTLYSFDTRRDSISGLYGLNPLERQKSDLRFKRSRHLEAIRRETRNTPHV